ncbi:unnamed protein product [Amoebophrya sp. A25]|nr:unnamed protein product [Amoebophrya sp. A25]|eukprot:GSA25T00005240001.1
MFWLFIFEFAFLPENNQKVKIMEATGTAFPMRSLFGPRRRWSVITSMLWAGAFWLALFSPAATAEYEPAEMTCALCQYVAWTGSCEHFGVCDLNLNSDTCFADHCSPEAHRQRARDVLSAAGREADRAPVALLSPGDSAVLADQHIQADSNAVVRRAEQNEEQVTGDGNSVEEQDRGSRTMINKGYAPVAVSYLGSNGSAISGVFARPLEAFSGLLGGSTAVGTAGDFVNLRVTKAMAPRGYDVLRVTVISKQAKPYAKVSPAFDYSAAFKWTWTSNHLNTGLVRGQVTTGTAELAQDQESLGNALSAPGAGSFFGIRHYEQKKQVVLEYDQHRIPLPSLPVPGSGVSGVFIADPCFRTDSLTTLIDCIYEEKFQLSKRTPEILRTFVGADPAVSFWGILGDNFYDRTGDATDWIFGQLDDATRRKIMYTVHGNHDYWVLGMPRVGTTFDQCGNGLTQYYGQDVLASLHQKSNSADEIEKHDEQEEKQDEQDQNAPYDLSIDPAAGRHLFGCNPLAQKNTFSYSQHGNMLVVAYSAVYSWRSQFNDFRDACAFALKEKTIELMLVVGHWNFCNSGCNMENDERMSLSHVLERMKSQISECKQFDRDGVAADVDRSSGPINKKAVEVQRGELASTKTTSSSDVGGSGRIQSAMGHTHCNRVERGGAMVAGYGMHGCGNFGVPVFDTTGGRYRVFYFKIIGDASSSSSTSGNVEQVEHDYYDEMIGCMKQKGTWRACAAKHAEIWIDVVLPPRPQKRTLTALHEDATLYV